MVMLDVPDDIADTELLAIADTLVSLRAPPRPLSYRHRFHHSRRPTQPPTHDPSLVPSFLQK